MFNMEETFHNCSGGMMALVGVSHRADQGVAGGCPMSSLNDAGSVIIYQSCFA